MGANDGELRENRQIRSVRGTPGHPLVANIRQMVG